LANSANKKSLIKFLTNEWKQEKYRQKLLDKTLFIACEDVCIKLSRDGEESVPELGSTQEEAETRLLLHASHAAYQALLPLSSSLKIQMSSYYVFITLEKPSLAQYF